MSWDNYMHRVTCALRDLLGVSPPDTQEALRGIQVDDESLRARYETSGMSAKKDTFILYRIVGNDLPPRHEAGQSLRSLRFILENEPDLEGCKKKFLVNRIVDARVEEEVLGVLESFGVPYTHIPFVQEEYAEVPMDYDCLPRRNYLDTKRYKSLRVRHQVRLLTAVNRLRNNYVMHNNGARNAAIEDGVGRAKWVLPFDGNCFFTKSAWEELYNSVTSRPWLPYFVVPMDRVRDNSSLLDSEYIPSAYEEPQLLFRQDATERFNEEFPYGRFPKIEMFWRLGIPGSWSFTVEKAWDPARRPLAPDACSFGVAGWVARLYSGVGHLEVAGDKSPSRRGDARREAILDLLSQLDHEITGRSVIDQYR